MHLSIFLQSLLQPSPRKFSRGKLSTSMWFSLALSSGYPDESFPKQAPTILLSLDNSGYFQGRLREEPREVLEELLPDFSHNDLGNVCYWPQEAKYWYPWSSSLHHVYTPDLLCNYDYDSELLCSLLSL